MTPIPAIDRVSELPEMGVKKAVMDKRTLQVLILVGGLLGAMVAFATTPKVYYVPNPSGGGPPARWGCSDNVKPRCVLDTGTAVARGGGVLLLAGMAFAGIALIVRDEEQN